MATSKSDVVGVAEVAEILGVRKPNVYRIPDLPEPAMEIKSGRLWDRPTIEAFAVAFKEHPGDLDARRKKMEARARQEAARLKKNARARARRKAAA